MFSRFVIVLWAAERASCKQLKVGEQFIVSEFKPIAEMQLYNQEMLRKHFMLSVERKVQDLVDILHGMLKRVPKDNRTTRINNRCKSFEVFLALSDVIA